MISNFEIQKTKIKNMNKVNCQLQIIKIKNIYVVANVQIQLMYTLAS